MPFQNTPNLQLHIIDTGNTNWGSLANDNTAKLDAALGPVSPAIWGSTIPYPIGAFVSYLGVKYTSLQNANLNNIPVSSPTFWSVATTSVPNGGTGQGTLTAHGVLIGEGISAVAVAAPGTAGQVLTSNGAAADPTMQPVSVAAPTGTLPVANGGTGAATLAAHNVLVGEGTSSVVPIAPGASGQVLTSNGPAADPSFQAAIAVTSLTGDVTGSGPGATATTVAKIHGVTVAAPTGTAGTGVVLADSPLGNPTATTIGVGTTAPQSELHVASSSANTERGVISEQLGATAVGAEVNLYKNRGTRAAPVAVANADALGQLNFLGYDGTTDLPSAVRSAQVVAAATQAWTNAAHGCQIQILTTPNGSVVAAVRLTIGQDGTITSAGNLVFSAVNNGLNLKTGSNGRVGTGTLSGGTLAVANTSVTANSFIFVQDTGGGTIANIGNLYVASQTAGVGFTVTSTNAIDNSTFKYWIMETT